MRQATTAPLPAPAALLLAAALLLPPAAGVGCPSISDVTLAGASGAGEPALLAGLDFPATVMYSWVDSMSNTDYCSIPDDAKDLSMFDITVEGAMLKSINYDDNETQLVIDVEFPEGGDDTTFKVTFTDPSGTCTATSATLERYVYEKNVPLVPLLAVFFLCPLTRDVYFSLGVSGILGWMILERNPWLGFLRYFDTGLPDQIAGGFRHIMLFLFMMGGIVGATIRVGGVQGLGDQVVKVIKDSFLAQAAVYILGWVIFLDDYATTVIVATTLRMITDKMRVSREKLSFLVDCTASPIAGLMPISTWIAHELFVLETALTNAGFDDQPYTILLTSIPKRFYSWFMLTFVAANFIIGRDWAFMYWVEKKAREEGIPGAEERDENGKEDAEAEAAEKENKSMVDAEFALQPKQGIPARWYNAFLPYFLLIALFVVMLFYSGATGNDGLYEGSGWDAPVKDIVGNADSWAVLKWVAGLVLTFQVLILYPLQYNKEWGGCIMWPRETVMAAIDGSKEYFGGALALMLAFTFAETMKDLQIDQYLVQMLGDSLSSAELPALTFILCAIFSMATGTSWGTMLVFMPTCVLLSKAVGGLDDTDLLTSVVASVLGGAVWGDHCSPVSDTTILSAAASSCPLLAHTITQLPYALFIGFYAILMGFLPTGGGAPAGLMIVIGLILIPLMHFGLSMIPNFGGPVPIYNPDLKAVTGTGCLGALHSIKSLATGGKSARQMEVQEQDPM